MKVLAAGLLAIIALGSGDLTGSTNEMRYNRPENIILTACDQNAMQICRRNWNICSNICRSGGAVHQQTC